MHIQCGEKCQGCIHEGTGTNLQCGIYGIPPNFYVRMGCPFNPPKTEAMKAKKLNPLKAAKRAKRGH